MVVYKLIGNMVWEEGHMLQFYISTSMSSTTFVKRGQESIQVSSPFLLYRKAAEHRKAA